MSQTYDTVIVGAGLAGICSALHLCSRERVLVVDSTDGRGSASRIAAGLANTFMARKARPVWRYREAIDALVVTLEIAGAADLFDRSGIFRPASDHQQATFFKQVDDAHEECFFVNREQALERWPSVRSPLGGLMIEGSGAVDVPAFLDHGIDALHSRGAEVRSQCQIESIDDTDTLASVTTEDGERIATRRVLVAAGDGTQHISGLPPLNLHRIKGQTVELTRTAAELTTDVPHLAGVGYVVTQKSGFVVGSNFQHTFSNLLPDSEVTHEILEKACIMIPGLSGETVVKESAAARMTVPGRRLPMIGPIPGKRRVWIFSGLGSKGLLMAPLIAGSLIKYLAEPDSIPPVLRAGRSRT